MPAEPGVAPGNHRRDVTLLLDAIRSGKSDAASELLPLVYAELRRLAASRMAHLPPGHTLQPTALVHEAYAELVGSQDPGWNGRAHFFGAAAQAMREILVDHARSKGRLKRGGDRKRVQLNEQAAAALHFELPNEDILALDEALDKLKVEHPRKAEVVMLRFFAGLTIEQTAKVLDVTTRTIDFDWRFAKAWLFKELSGGEPA